MNVHFVSVRPRSYSAWFIELYWSILHEDNPADECEIFVLQAITVCCIDHELNVPRSFLSYRPNALSLVSQCRTAIWRTFTGKGRQMEYGRHLQARGGKCLLLLRLTNGQWPRFCHFLPLHLDVAMDLLPLEIESGYVTDYIILVLDLKQSSYKQRSINHRLCLSVCLSVSLCLSASLSYGLIFSILIWLWISFGAPSVDALCIRPWLYRSC